MINTKDLLLAKLMWPTKPPDKEEAKRQATCLAAARRCLHASAPAELHKTGFQLLHRGYEQDLKYCLQNILTEQGWGLSQVLILLDAPPVTEHSELVYKRTQNDLLEAVAEELESLSVKLPTIRITDRLFDKVTYAYKVVNELYDLPLLVKLGALLDQLTLLDHAKDRDKSSRLCVNLAKLIRSKI